VTTAVAPPVDLNALEHTYIGPSWSRTPLGTFLTPEDVGLKTLGWEIAAWCTKYLNDPDGGRWKFTNEQFRLLLWWYATDDDGRFTARKGVLQRLKGWGKDPFAAVLAIVEFVGPSQFSHFNEAGEPVGKAHRRAWVQVAAVSRDQTRNTMTLMPALMSQKLIEAYGIKAGAELIRGNKGRCRIEAVTSNYRSLEGGRSTFVILNETHHWIKSNQGDLMYETVANNTAKMNCRYLAITNAYLPGEGSVAEKMREQYEKVQAGTEPDTGLLYDTIEADERTPLTEAGLRAALPILRGDATWLNVDSILSVALDSSISEARRRRMWLNQVVTDKDALYALHHLRTLIRDADLRPGDEIVLGFDGGRYEDSTALVAIRIRDRCTFLIRAWEKPSTWDTHTRGRWEVNTASVDSEVRAAFRTFAVKAFFSDVNLWESYVKEWTADLGPGLAVKATAAGAIAWDMRNSAKESTRAHERLMGALTDSSISFNGDETLRRHTMNARRAENTWGTYFRAESHDSTRKVDAYAAWLLAHEALHRYLTDGRPKKKSKTGAGFFL
jgi:phage terminase large subunit-like protein